jgi:lysophospholipase
MAGRTEPMHKLFEVAYDLHDLGFSIYLMDHRGQGQSGRLLDDPMRGHVEDFDDYVDDLHTFIENHVKARPHQRLFILAKSMGACIATRFAEQHGHLIDGLILSAPMFAINFGNIPEAVAYSVAVGAWAIGKGEDYASGKGPYEPDPDEFGKYLTTHSPERYQMGVSLLMQHPELLVGGPTNRWIKEAIESTWAAKRDASDLKMPVLILQADIDHYVHNEDQDLVCDRAEDCKKVHLDGAYHEILMETDDIRDRALEQIEQFLQRWYTSSFAS